MEKKKASSTSSQDALKKVLDLFLGAVGRINDGSSGYLHYTDYGASPAMYSGINNNVLVKDNYVYDYTNIASSLYPLQNLIDVITRKEEASDEDAERLAEEAEQYGMDWIYDNYCKSDIENGDDLLGERVLDKIVDWVEETVLDRYDFPDQDIFADFVDSVIDNIDLGSVLSVVDDILAAPITMSEKLRDIGMSERDFM